MATLSSSVPASSTSGVLASTALRNSRPQPLRMPADTDGLATLSHELKTPLVALLGFVQLLESDARQPLSAPQLRRAQEIERAGQQMLDLVTTLLDQARRGEWNAAAARR